MTVTNSSNFTASDELEEKEEVQGTETESTDAPSFDELSAAFDKQLDMLIKKDGLIDSLSLKSLRRVMKKTLAYPLKDDDVVLFQKNETIPYEIMVNVQQLKMNMMLEQIRLAHIEEAEKIKKNNKPLED